MFIAAFCTVLALLFLALKFGKNFLKRVIGMDWFVDIAVTVFLMWIFAITGTISGLLTGIMAGLMVSIMLLAARMVLPHQKLVRKGTTLVWEEQPGVLFAAMAGPAEKKRQWERPTFDFKMPDIPKAPPWLQSIIDELKYDDRKTLGR